GYEGEQGIYVHYRPATADEIQAFEAHSQRVQIANETLFPAYKAAHDALRSALFRTAGAANGAHIFASILPVLGRKYTNESVKAELDAYWAAKDAYEAAIQWRAS